MLSAYPLPWPWLRQILSQWNVKGLRLSDGLRGIRTHPSAMISSLIVHADCCYGLRCDGSEGASSDDRDYFKFNKRHYAATVEGLGLEKGGVPDDKTADVAFQTFGEARGFRE